MENEVVVNELDLPSLLDISTEDAALAAQELGVELATNQEDNGQNLLDTELSIISNYESLEDALDLCDGAAESNFSKVRALPSILGVDTAEGFDKEMTTLASEYVEMKVGDSTIRTYFRKRDSWKLRKVRLPAVDTLRTELEIQKIKFKEVESNGKKVFIVNGVPDGFYSAWKTVTRAMENNIPGWEHMAKSEIDKAIKDCKEKPPKVYTEEGFVMGIIPEVQGYIQELFKTAPFNGKTSEQKRIINLMKVGLDHIANFIESEQTPF